MHTSAEIPLAPINLLACVCVPGLASQVATPYGESTTPIPTAVVLAAATNVCCEQSTYGNGIGVAAARGHLDVPVIVALEPSVVSDVGPGLSSGVGLGVSSDFGLAPCPAPW